MCECIYIFHRGIIYIERHTLIISFGNNEQTHALIYIYAHTLVPMNTHPITL